jgi:hypothetical protein
VLFALADNGNRRSLAAWYRRQRIRRFAEVLRTAGASPRILDVGGTAKFWEAHSNELPSSASVVILNRVPEEGTRGKESRIRRMVTGDACEMRMFCDREFDMVFSNSVIEHVGTEADQARMAHEIRRVGRAYFVQTPNRFFPIEPHFLAPFWHYAPIGVRAYLLQRRRWGWVERVDDPVLAREAVESIRLLSSNSLRRMFPDARIDREMFGPLTKSLVAWRPATCSN